VAELALDEQMLQEVLGSACFLVLGRVQISQSQSAKIEAEMCETSQDQQDPDLSVIPFHSDGP
jgi:hypothetical protein